MKEQNDIENELLQPTRISPKPKISKKLMKKWSKVMKKVKF